MDLSAISRMSWADVELEHIAWAQAGRDLTFHLRLPGRDRARGSRVMTCRSAEALTVSFLFPDGGGGYPLTWGVTFSALPDGRSAVVFDFADSGAIRLLCAEIEVSSAYRE